MLWRSRSDDDPHPLDAPLVAYAGFLGGAWSIIFALPFRDLDTWPRDPAVAGAIQILCAMRVVVEMIRGRRRRRERGGHESARHTEDLIEGRRSGVHPVGTGLPGGDET